MKKSILLSLFATSALSLCAAEKPNILFIMVDDLGWTDMSTGKPNLGNESDYYETPHLDTLASKGMSFPFAYSNGPNCAPTRATLYSGQYSPRTKCYNVKSTNRGGKNAKLLGPANKQFLDLDIVTFAESVKKVGYTTAHFGKWHAGGHLGGGLPTEQGFDLNIGGNNIGGSVAGFFAKADGSFKARRGQPEMPNLGPNGKSGQWLDDRLTDECLSWMEKVKDQPFLIDFCFYAVHSPNSSPKEDKAHFDDKPVGKRHKNQTYAGFVKSYDDNIGRLVTYLEQTGDPRNPGAKLIKNTVIVFTSDNGGCGGWVKPWGDHYTVTTQAPLKNGKGSLYEGGVRVPFIVRWDGHVPADSQNHETVGTVDLYPTFVELAGASLPEQQVIDGMSLVSLIQGKQKKLERDAFYFHFPAYLARRQTPASVIRQGDLKLMFWYESKTWEMYDVVKDISEKTNIIKEHPEKAKQMAAKLIKWLDETGADYPTDKKTGKTILPVSL